VTAGEGGAEERGEEEVEAAVDVAVKKRREIAALLRKRITDAEKMVKKKVVSDLEDGLARCAVVDSISAHPPAVGHLPEIKKDKPKKVKKVAAPKRSAVVESEPPKPLLKLEKTVLECLVKVFLLLHSWMQCVALCCSVLPCAVVCCCVLSCAAACCSVLQCAAVCCIVLRCAAVCCCVLPCVAQTHVCCSDSFVRDDR